MRPHLHGGLGDGGAAAEPQTAQPGQAAQPRAREPLARGQVQVRQPQRQRLRPGF